MRALLWPATRGDVSQLAREMRAGDRDEVTAAACAVGRMDSDWTLEGDLLSTFDQHQMWSMWRGDDLLGLGGILPFDDLPDVGAVWFLGTRRADTHWRSMTEAADRFLRVFGKDFTNIGNMLPCSSLKRRKWLEYLGFDFIEGEAQLCLEGFDVFWLRPTPGPEDRPAAP